MDLPPASWQRVVSPSQPFRFDGAGALELRSAVLKTGSCAKLYCSSSGSLTSLALARITTELPVCRLQVHFEGEPAEITCANGELLLLGTLRSVSASSSSKRALEASAVSGSTAKKLKPSPATERLVDQRASSSPKVAARLSPKLSPKVEARVSPKLSPKLASQQVKADSDSAVADQGGKLKKKKKATVEKVIKTIRSGALPCGLTFDVLKAGGGSPVPLGRQVKIRYESHIVGQEECYDFGTAEFRLGLGEVIRGWEEGVKGMLVGEKRRLRVPSRLGYGSKGLPPKIPPNSNLMIDVELLKG